VTNDYSNLRNIPIERWRDLLATPGVEWHSLCLTRASECPPHVINRAPELTDFLATARIVAELDLVITVDSSVANLCGSMGVPFWVLVNQDGEADWRWSLGWEHGQRSMWYPSARVFRQGGDRKWKKPMRQAREALEKWLEAYHERRLPREQQAA
jgi:hypothetical protein